MGVSYSSVSRRGGRVRFSGATGIALRDLRLGRGGGPLPLLGAPAAILGETDCILERYSIVLPTLLFPTVQISNKAIQTVPKQLTGDAILGYIFYVVRTQPSAKQISQEWQHIEFCINQALGTGIFK